MLFEPAEQGGCVVTFPERAGLVKEGGTLEGARKMARDATRACLERSRKEGPPW